MSTTTLIKCIEELKSITPRIDYVLGMLETLMEMQGSPTPLTPPNLPRNAPIQRTEEVADEDSNVLNAYLGGPTGRVTT